MSDKETISRDMFPLRNVTTTAAGSEIKQTTPSPPKEQILAKQKNIIEKKQGESTMEWQKNHPQEKLEAYKLAWTNAEEKNNVLENEIKTLRSIQENLQVQLNDQKAELLEKNRLNEEFSSNLDEHVKQSDLLRERINDYDLKFIEKDATITKLEKTNTVIRNQLRFSALEKEKLRAVVGELKAYKDHSEKQRRKMESSILSLLSELQKVKSAQADSSIDDKVSLVLDIVRQEPMELDGCSSTEQIRNLAISEPMVLDPDSDEKLPQSVEGTVTSEKNLESQVRRLEKQVVELNQELTECKTAHSETLQQLEAVRIRTQDERKAPRFYDLGKSLSEGDLKWKMQQCSGVRFNKFSVSQVKERMKDIELERDVETSALNTYFNSLTNNHEENKKALVGCDDEDEERTVEEEKNWRLQTNTDVWIRFFRPVYGIPQSVFENEEKYSRNYVTSLQKWLQLANSRVEQMSKKLMDYEEEFRRREEDERVSKENLQSEIVELQNQVSCLKVKIKGEASLMEVINNLKSQVSDIKSEKAVLSEQHQMQISLYRSMREKIEENCNWESRMIELEEQLNNYKTSFGHNQPRVISKYFSLNLMPSRRSDDGQEGVLIESREEPKNNLSIEKHSPQLVSLSQKRADLNFTKVVFPGIRGTTKGTNDLFPNLDVCNSSILPETSPKSSMELEKEIVNLQFLMMEQKIVIKHLQNKLAIQEMALTKAKMVRVKRKRSRSQSSDMRDISGLMSVEGDLNKSMDYRDRAMTDRELALERQQSKSAQRIKIIREELMMKDNIRKKEIDRLTGAVDMLKLKNNNYERQIRELGDKEQYILTLEKEISILTSDLVNSRKEFHLLRSSKDDTVGRLSSEIERMRLNSPHLLSVKKGSLPCARRASTRGNMKSSETAREGSVTTLPYFGNV